MYIFPKFRIVSAHLMHNCVIYVCILSIYALQLVNVFLTVFMLFILDFV